MAVYPMLFHCIMQEGKHPLSWVSYHGRRDLAELFLQHGAEVDLATNVRLEIASCVHGSHGAVSYMYSKT